jgi:UDP-N-acetylglucosamine:LPS N-acetylglucosamine transferase
MSVQHGPMERILLLYGDAGGGHRSSAEAVRAVLQDSTSWDVRLVDLYEELRPLDRLHKLTGTQLEDWYNFALRRNWTWGGSFAVSALHSAIRRAHADQVSLLTPFWQHHQPDIVVSLLPHFNRAIGESLRRALPAVPFVVLLTDIADTPPHFWIEPEAQYVICGSDRAVYQARAAGIRSDRIYRTSGMVVHPRFYHPLNADRSAERARLGLDPDVPTGLVMFGGEGSAVMLEIAERLDRSSLNFQLVLLCGRNLKLASQLREARLRLKSCVVGYTTQVPSYMHISDFFIGKPGPGSISEALVMNLPVIVERNARTMPQERYNVDWVSQKQLGLVVPSFRHIDDAVRKLLSTGWLSRLRANVAMIQNRAVFEIEGILREILERSRQSLAS